jgi:hypothetical protein
LAGNREPSQTLVNRALPCKLWHMENSEELGKDNLRREKYVQLFVIAKGKQYDC